MPDVERDPETGLRVVREKSACFSIGRPSDGDDPPQSGVREPRSPVPKAGPSAWAERQAEAE